jgi:hypothetical protein
LIRRLNDLKALASRSPPFLAGQALQNTSHDPSTGAALELPIFSILLKQATMQGTLDLFGALSFAPCKLYSAQTDLLQAIITDPASNCK